MASHRRIPCSCLRSVEAPQLVPRRWRCASRTVLGARDDLGERLALASAARRLFVLPTTPVFKPGLQLYLMLPARCSSSLSLSSLWPTSSCGHPIDCCVKRRLSWALAGDAWLPSCRPQTRHERPRVAQRGLLRHVVVSLIPCCWCSLAVRSAGKRSRGLTTARPGCSSRERESH